MMTRQFDMCEVCKLDKAQKCDYTCVKQRYDFMFRFFTCPNFIYDDGNPITNAERISMLLKTNPDSVAEEMWNKIELNNKGAKYHNFRKWLKQESE